ncbi:MAG: T9SS type A sorting domain-containing protein [Bacteroidota bacterium]
MKKNILPFSLALACLTWLPAISQKWQPLGHGLLPTGYALYGISVVSENVIWAVADVDTATIPPVPAGHLIKVIKTTDGGLNWSVYDVEESVGRVSWNVEAVDDKTAWLTTQDLGSGLGRALYKTEDGGETWTQKLFHRAGGVFVRALDESHIYCQNGRFAGWSEDGGETWTLDTLEAYAADEFNVLYSGNNMAAAVGDTVWVGTTKGRVCRATNFGNTIELIDIDTSAEFEIVNVAFNDHLHGMLQSLNPTDFTARLHITSDGGATWQLAASQPPPDGRNYNIAALPGIAGAFVLIQDPYSTMMSNEVNAFYTLDFGNTLNLVEPATGTSNSVDFISPTKGWATAGLIVDENTPAFFKWEAPAVNPVALAETFDALTAPLGWMAEGYWDFGTRLTHSTSFFAPPEHGTFAVLNDDLLGGPAISKDKLITPQLDLAFYEEVRLTFESFFVNGDWNGADETAKVLVSTDSLATWQEIFEIESGSDVWQTVRVSLSDFAGQKIHLAFEYDDALEWNYGWAVDDVVIGLTPAYDAEASTGKISEYSINTPKHLPALQANFAVENFGSASLAGVTVQFDVLHDGSPFFNTNLPLPEITSFTTHQDDIALPALTATGNYDFNLAASHPELGGIFYENEQPLEISDSIMARDDGSRETSIGFPFGNPTWYGYYGSEFKLLQTDTLTGISIWITSQTAGAFNLVVNSKDELGIPKVPVFHSEPIPVPAGYNNWVYFHLPTPLILPPDTYLFAAGQDTVQGVHGFGFDATTFNLTYWIMGLLPSYEWTSYTTGGFNFNLMIRPHFNPLTPSGISEVPAGKMMLSPNPVTDFLRIELPENAGGAFEVQVFDARGRLLRNQSLADGQWLDLQGLATGMYSLKVVVGERVFAGKFVKQ